MAPNYLSSSSILFSKSTNLFILLLVVMIATTITISSDALPDEGRKVYIVYMGGLPAETEYSPSSHHQSILEEVVEGSLAKDALVVSYKRSFNGFAAKLTEREVPKLSGMEGIVSVFPNRILQLQTTRSWDFMGFSETVKRVPTAESNVIVGVIDTGIWPESVSFSDEEFGPPPKKWKGACEGGQNFTCNNKLIGARFYPKGQQGIDTARDTEGHGTHTASTAAGNLVKGASFFDLAKGTARGAVPSARIAVYKVCKPQGCYSADILAGFDDAIADGVDIISTSLGFTYPSDFDEDPIAIGSFHATAKGILTSHSAGNEGPRPQSVTSNAPWLLTVAASTTDRLFIDKVILGNGKTFVGSGVNSFSMNGTKFPLVYNYFNVKDPWFRKGKIVIDPNTVNGQDDLKYGAVGAILFDPDFDPVDSFIYPLPAVLLSAKFLSEVQSYFDTTKNPVATILKTESIKDSSAPVVAQFSSRGPNSFAPDIIKPDISAPGVDILAAFPPVASPSHFPGDKRSTKYSILSGTSMSCPHATGAAAYVKTFHPDWSPSAIKSALMTTATTMNDPGGEFAYGSGHIDPVKAVNPGLVYETLIDDYVKMLCDLGYNSSRVKLITDSTCPKGISINPSAGANQQLVVDLNYPSLGAHVQSEKPFKVNFTRIVTNVGSPNSTYKATITSSDKIKVTVEPDVLSFMSLNEKKSFVVHVVGDHGLIDLPARGSLVWSGGVHSVRSPIVVYPSKF